MNSYKELYYYLFRSLAQATKYIEQGQILLAYEKLVSAQQEAESSCMEFDIIPEQ